MTNVRAKLYLLRLFFPETTRDGRESTRSKNYKGSAKHSLSSIMDQLCGNCSKVGNLHGDANLPGDVRRRIYVAWTSPLMRVTLTSAARRRGLQWRHTSTHETSRGKVWYTKYKSLASRHARVTPSLRQRRARQTCSAQPRGLRRLLVSVQPYGRSGIRLL